VEVSPLAKGLSQKNGETCAEHNMWYLKSTSPLHLVVNKGFKPLVVSYRTAPRSGRWDTIHSMHKALVNILESKARPMVAARMALLLAWLALCAVRLRLLVLSWNAEHLYLRDMLQYYLMGKALRAGEYLYQPMNILALKLTGADRYYHHPSPYPPPMALFSVPLSYADLPRAPIVWFGIEFAALSVALILLTTWYRGKFSPWISGVVLIITLGFYPVWVSLVQGQVSVILLTLLAAAWMLMRARHTFAAGLLLGISISIKLFAWPVLLYFLLKKQWRTLIAAGLMAASLHALTAIFVGIEPLVDYYLRVPGEVLPYYQAHWYNVSLWTLGWRLFAGTESPMLVGPVAPPLVSLPGLAPIFSTLAVMAALGAGLYWALRSKSGDTSFALMVCTSLMISPITWIHYYSMVLIPIAVVLRGLKTRKYPPVETWSYAIPALGLILSTEWIQSLVRNTSIFTGEETAIASFAVSILNLMPAAALLGLSVCLRRMDVFAHKLGRPL